MDHNKIGFFSENAQIKLRNYMYKKFQSCGHPYGTDIERKD